MDDLLIGLRAAAETTRLRLLFALSHGEFNVSELTQILGQSQPRISRHLKLMTEAGLLARFKEGSWVLFRLRDDGVRGAIGRSIVDLLPGGDPILARDLARLEAVRAERAELAARYFRDNAANWEELRSRHVDDVEVEAAMLAALGPEEVDTLVDLGTGTGRILRLLAPQAGLALGLDSSREMLSLARAHLEAAGWRHAQVRHGDIYALPFANSGADLVTIHQVLHYLDEPARAIVEAARILNDGGRLLIVDFAPHEFEDLRSEHAHRRLGIAGPQMAGWLQTASLELVREDSLGPPERNRANGLTVSLWLARKVVAPTPTGEGRERSEGQRMATGRARG